MPRLLMSLLIAAMMAALRPAVAAELVDGEAHVVLNGVDHWYRVAGADHRTTPLIVLHGGPGGSAFVFEHTQGERLERFQTIVYYDQRGGGRSAAPRDPKDYRMDRLVSDLDGLRRHLGAAKISLLGFSFGAELALEYALAHPDDVDRLVLQAPTAGDYRRMAITQTYAFQSLLSGEARQRLAAIAATPLGSPGRRFEALWSLADRNIIDRFNYHNAEAAATARRLQLASGHKNSGLMGAVMFADDRKRARPLIEDAAQLTMPALVLVGAYDRTTGVDVARDLATVLPQGRLVVFPGSAHYPDIEEPDSYSRDVQAFMAGRSTESQDRR